MATENISPELLWAITADKSAFLLKRRENGGARFSKSPFSAAGKYTRNGAGTIKAKGSSLQKTKEGYTLTTKTEHANKPAQLYKQDAISGKPTKEEKKKFVQGGVEARARALQQASHRRVKKSATQTTKPAEKTAA